jgi:hypothetical protein
MGQVLHGCATTTEAIRHTLKRATNRSIAPNVYNSWHGKLLITFCRDIRGSTGFWPKLARIRETAENRE